MIDTIVNIGSILLIIGFVGMYIFVVGVLISLFREVIRDRAFSLAWGLGMCLLLAIGAGLVAFTWL